jgi:murein DD-endopeptidase MepM/ murein hydrolase activator NlpD
MIYATDVVKIGKRISRFLPQQNEEYLIYNENIYSPMEGKVVKVENNINDNEPYIGKYPYNTGNTIVIQNGIYYFLLGHLKKGSVIVKEGDLVKRSDLLGQVGNSGFSERPHLHMQLIVSNSENYWTGIGVCIQYEGKNIYKNRIIKVA